MENVQHFIGEDLSRKKVDLACRATKSHIGVENSIRGFSRITKWLQQQKIKLVDVIVIMKHIGLYSWRLETFLHQFGISYCKVSALEIKRSGVIVRVRLHRKFAMVNRQEVYSEVMSITA